MAGSGQIEAMTGLEDRERIPLAALVIGLLGLLPFFCGAIAAWRPELAPGIGGKLIVGYGAIILAFLGGIRWGTAIGPYDGRRQTLEFTASVIGSIVGLAALFVPLIPGLTLLIGSYLLHALWDVASAEAGRLPAWFGKLRMLLTAGAVFSLLLALVAAAIT